MSRNADAQTLQSMPISKMSVGCPGQAVMEHLTCRWGILSLVALGSGAKRFHQLRDEIDGISEKMLSQTLKLLARDGLLTRSADDSVPPKVTYELTLLGREATLRLRAITWGIQRGNEWVSQTVQAASTPLIKPPVRVLDVADASADPLDQCLEVTSEDIHKQHSQR